MSAGVASNKGRGVMEWPGRRLLPAEQLSTLELRSLATDRHTPPGVQKWARLNWGWRFRRSKMGRAMRAARGTGLVGRLFG